ncbi:MAG: hypothetical protein GY795_14305 [Desulfobacterales bacterium]|nr:hypothetical protein [Desulfobacterales bacterium]
MRHKLKTGIFISGVLNILLGILHQIVLYIQYQKMSVLKNPETAYWITDLVLFSIAVGTVLIFLGFLSCYCYYGVKNNEKWAKVTASGISLLLLAFAIEVFIIRGHGEFIFYVHLFNSLLIGIPLIINKQDESSQ